MTSSDYKKYQPYLAYVRHTNEKERFHAYLEETFKKRLLSIHPEQDCTHILDIGCGNGVNTVFMANMFSAYQIDGIDKSAAQLWYAKKHNRRSNIHYFLTSLEEFETNTFYDFILVSHVLQHMDIPLENFLAKSLHLLTHKGEIWFILQTKKGMNEIIEHQKPYLSNPKFQEWKTFEDFAPEIQKLASAKEYKIEIEVLPTSIRAINFQKPSKKDKLRLGFMFLLDKPFDRQSEEFKKHLANLELGCRGRIEHPNGIIKLKRIS